MFSTGIHNFTAAHFKEHCYCSAAFDNRGIGSDGNPPSYSRFAASQENMSYSGNFSRQQPFAQSEEPCHFRSHSASESVSYGPATKRPRTARRSASQTGSVSGSKKCVQSQDYKKSPSTISLAPEYHGNSQRLSKPKKPASPLSSSSANVPSSSSVSTSFRSHQNKARKVSDDKTSSGSKRSNFSKEQTGVLNGWLKLNLEHPYPTEDEKNLLAERAGITLNQVNNYYINARRRSAYKKMCKEHGVVPTAKKNARKSPTSNHVEEDNKENQVRVRGLDYGFCSDSSRPASASSLEGNVQDQVCSSSSSAGSSSSPASSPKVEASQDPVFVADSGFNPVQCPPASYPELGISQVPVFVTGSGFIPAPPLPSDVSPEILAVSREVVEPVYIDIPRGDSMFQALLCIAEKFRDADVKAYECNLPREYYFAERLMDEHPDAVMHVRKPGSDV